MTNPHPNRTGMNDLYVENGKVRGRCSVCGDTKQYKQSRNPKYFKPYYFAVFEKNDWFRGNDTYRGKVCKACLKAGLIAEANKGFAEKAMAAREAMG
jgi:hypothetical protein